MTRPTPGRDQPVAEFHQVSAVAATVAAVLTRPTGLLTAAPPAGPAWRSPDASGAPDDTADDTADDTPDDPADDTARTLWATHRDSPSRSTRDRLVLHYRPLVRAVVRRAAGRLPAHVEHADLVQSGVFGLLEAIERYDPGRCPRFESYAALRIRGAVLDELRAQDWVPRTVRVRARDAARAREHLTLVLGRTATEREVADALRVGARELSAAAPTRLLSMELLREGGDGGVVDTFADDAPDPAAAAQVRELHRQLGLAVAQLGERDRQVVRLYYLERRTLAEIGRLLGVTESRICQLHTRVVGRLRGALDELAAS